MTATDTSRVHLLAAIGEAFAAVDTTTDSALATIMRVLAHHFGDGCGAYIVGEADAAGSWHHDATLSPFVHATFGALSRPGYDGLSGRVMRTGTPIRLARTTPEEVYPFAAPQAFPALVRHGFHSALLVPMRVPGRTIGVLTALRDRTPTAYTATEQLLLQELADNIALTIVTVNLAKLTYRAESLAEDDRLHREAIATVSHDLRTPLAAVQIALGLLADTTTGQLAPEAAELLATARRGTQRLVIIIEDLLAMNQIEAGVLELSMKPLDLRTVITEAARTVRPLLQEKQQELLLAFSAPLPTRGDARRLEQVATNLLANAHRHTPPGTRVVLSGELVGAEVHLRLRDNGPGLSPRDLDRIFHRHHRREAGGGSGLGLATAWALVTQHGGRLWAENAPSGGAVFHLVLPATASPQP